MIEVNERFERQSRFIDTYRLRETSALVVGVGSVGRNVALQLASLGVGAIGLCDHDTVEERNISTQGWKREDIGKKKVAVVAQAILAIDPEIGVYEFPEKYDPEKYQELLGFESVFSCPDKIAVRKQVYESVKGESKLIVDGRQTLECNYVYTWQEGCDKEYEGTFFDDKDAWDSGCTPQGVIYTGMITAGLMLHQFVRYLTKRETDLGILLMLPASTLIPVVSKEEKEEECQPQQPQEGEAPAEAVAESPVAS